MSSRRCETSIKGEIRQHRYSIFSHMKLIRYKKVTSKVHVVGELIIASVQHMTIQVKISAPAAFFHVATKSSFSILEIKIEIIKYAYLHVYVLYVPGFRNKTQTLIILLAILHIFPGGSNADLKPILENQCSHILSNTQAHQHSH